MLSLRDEMCRGELSPCEPTHFLALWHPLKITAEEIVEGQDEEDEDGEDGKEEKDEEDDNREDEEEQEDEEEVEVDEEEGQDEEDEGDEGEDDDEVEGRMKNGLEDELDEDWE